MNTSNPNTKTDTAGASTTAGHLGDTLQVTAAMVALAGAAGRSDSLGDHHWVVLPAGYKREDITAAVQAAQPVRSRKQGKVSLSDVQSLLAYCADQNAANEAAAHGYIYANPDARTITAVFNDQRSMLPGWQDHRAEFKAHYTPEFETWLRNNRQPKTQTEFAEFIEENFADITEPAAAVLLDIATTLQAKTEINFSSGKRLQNGQAQLTYVENINATAGATGLLEVPKEFTLGLRIFKNGGGYKIRARLKYRLTAGSVKFWYELDRVEKSVEDAFAGYIAEVKEKSGYQVLIGTPG